MSNFDLFAQGKSCGAWTGARSLVLAPSPSATSLASVVRPAGQAVPPATPCPHRLLQGLHALELPPVSRRGRQLPAPLEQRQHVEALPSLARRTSHRFAKVFS